MRGIPVSERVFAVVIMTIALAAALLSQWVEDRDDSVALRWHDCPGNFVQTNGVIWLAECPFCRQQNDALAASNGVCVWCGWPEIEEWR